MVNQEEVDISDRMTLAFYIHTLFPELSIREVFIVMEDPMFLVLILNTIKEASNEH